VNYTKFVHPTKIVAAMLIVVLTGCDPQPDLSSTSGIRVADSDEDLVSNFSEDTPRDKNFRPLSAVRAFEPITEIPTKNVRDAGDDVDDDDLVLGIEINGESRAYPIVQLCGPHREIINDQLGGKSIAATW
jgi:hypothetical protein